MKAIPTAYGGVSFRSRLEADWAATLDGWHVDWQYEPEGYELSDGTRYMPDFWLPGQRTWLEVKGSHNERVTKVEQFARDIWLEAWKQTREYDTLHRPMALSGEPTDLVATSKAAPLVLLGRELQSDYGNPHPPLPLGIRAPGHYYSTWPAFCDDCRGLSIIAIGASCRRCDSTRQLKCACCTGRARVTLAPRWSQT